MSANEKIVSNRIGKMDVAKAVGIISIVLAHNDAFPVASLKALICPYYIALFFVISGYFDKGTFNLKRVAFLIKTFCGYTGLLFFASVFDSDNKYSYIERLGRAFYGRFCLFPLGQDDNIYMQVMYNHPMWFLPAFTLSMLIFWWILQAFRAIDDKSSILIIGFIIFIIFFGWLYFFTKCPILLPCSIDTIPVFTLFLLFGYLIRQVGLEYFLSKRGMLISIITSIPSYYFLIKLNRGINIAVRKYGGNNEWYNIILYILIGISGTWICLWVCSLINKIPVISALLRFIGRHTIIIMCLHVYMWHFFEHYFNNALYRFIASLMCVLILSLIDSLWLYHRKKFCNVIRNRFRLIISKA